MREAFKRMRTYPIGVIVLAIVVVGETAFLYTPFLLSADASATALQPDSLQYVCYGLLLSGADAQSTLNVTGTFFAHFNQDPRSCQWIGLSEPLVWQVYPRLLLPALMVPATFLFASWGAAVPSIIFFFGIATLWCLALYSNAAPQSKVVAQIFYTLGAVLPFLAFTMALWLGAILTEGPITFLLMLAAIVLASRVKYRTQLLSIGVLGLLILLTRQTWPLVAILWAAGVLHRGRVSISSGLWRSATALLIVGGAFGLAFILNQLLEYLTIPPGAKEARPDLPEGLGFTASEAPAVLLAAGTSTWSDMALAIARFDFLSPVLLVSGLAALAYLVRHHEWALALIGVTAFGLGFISIGIFGSDIANYNTHFRYLVPATMFSLTASLAIRSRNMQTLEPLSIRLRS